MESSNLDNLTGQCDGLEPVNLDQLLAEKQKSDALERAMIDLNRVQENNQDLDYHPSYKANLNMEQIGYTLEWISKYLELVNRDLDPAKYPKKYGKLMQGLEALNTTVEKICIEKSD